MLIVALFIKYTIANPNRSGTMCLEDVGVSCRYAQYVVYVGKVGMSTESQST